MAKNPIINPRLLLLTPSRSYRAKDFLDAARRLDVDVVVGSDHRHALAELSGDHTVYLDFQRPETSVENIVTRAARTSFSAVVGTDDEVLEIAAAAAKRLNLRHNNPKAVAAARDKYQFRKITAKAGLLSPGFQRVSLNSDLNRAAQRCRYPCVLKPLTLSGSRGVIRANSKDEFLAACSRIKAILRGINLDDPYSHVIIVEDYIDGFEVTLEGLILNHVLHVLAIFDKPDPLDGPYFEETLYVTPSRLPQDVQRNIIDQTKGAVAALGLNHGPVHAELRVNETDATLIELAARSIGGLCSRVFEFGGDFTLEELILRDALGLDLPQFTPPDTAKGVMMIPVPTAGILTKISGVEDAKKVPNIKDVVINARPGETIVPLPEGGRYPGFIFAAADTAKEVEAALRKAHQLLRFEVGTSNSQSGAETRQ